MALTNHDIVSVGCVDVSQFVSEAASGSMMAKLTTIMAGLTWGCDQTYERSRFCVTGERASLNVFVSKCVAFGEFESWRIRLARGRVRVDCARGSAQVALRPCGTHGAPSTTRVLVSVGLCNAVRLLHS